MRALYVALTRSTPAADDRATPGISRRRWPDRSVADGCWQVPTSMAAVVDLPNVEGRGEVGGRRGAREVGGRPCRRRRRGRNSTAVAKRRTLASKSSSSSGRAADDLLAHGLPQLVDALGGRLVVALAIIRRERSVASSTSSGSSSAAVPSTSVGAALATTAEPAPVTSPARSCRSPRSVVAAHAVDARTSSGRARVGRERASPPVTPSPGCARWRTRRRRRGGRRSRR